MDFRISEDKLENIINTVVNGLGIDKRDSFQVRSGHLSYIEFLTPGTRKNVISRYYDGLNLVVVNNEKLYDLVSVWVGSKGVYDLIKDEIIKRIYKKYTGRFKSLYQGEIRTIKYMDDEQFNKK